MIDRKLQKKLTVISKKFPVISVLGPRQSGKTTLCKSTFPKVNYVNLEDPLMKEFALNDPKGFLKQYRGKHGLIIDEAQYAPVLFSYIQILADETNESSQFILTGSQNFLLNAKIAQSLAGRVAILTLLPFSLAELKKEKLLPQDYEEVLLKGFYPRLWDKKLAPTDMYSGYNQTYLEKDIRQMTNVMDLRIFQKFLRLVAGRVGCVLNYSELASDTGISVNTAKSWISLLEASFILFLLPPYYKNYSKRLIKSPKIYFYDPGLACYLLGISTKSHLQSHPLKGNLFESMIMCDIKKRFFNRGEIPNLYFWRDHTGLEIDGILETHGNLIPFEIKSSRTFNTSFFFPLLKFNEFTKEKNIAHVLVYGGSESQDRKNGKIISWKEPTWA